VVGTRVVGQRPAAGETVLRGSGVRLRLEGDPPEGGPLWNAADPPHVVVPDVIHVPRLQAETTLARQGFGVAVSPVEGARNPAFVVGQGYVPGARIRQGTTVGLILADMPGAEAAPVPPPPDRDESVLERVGGFFRRIPREIEKIPGRIEDLVR
jgi:hypothetical protein